MSFWCGLALFLSASLLAVILGEYNHRICNLEEDRRVRNKERMDALWRDDDRQ